MKKLLLVGGLGAALAGAAFFALGGGPAGADRIVLSPDDVDVVARGSDLYTANCAACHGANLEGQADWRQRDANGMLPAPPHDETGHTWHHDSTTLFGLTKYGVGEMIGDPDYVSNMPAYEGVLADDEIIAVLSYIKSTWPANVRATQDERDAAR